MSNNLTLCLQWLFVKARDYPGYRPGPRFATIATKFDQPDRTFFCRRTRSEEVLIAEESISSAVVPGCKFFLNLTSWAQINARPNHQYSDFQTQIDLKFGSKFILIEEKKHLQSQDRMFLQATETWEKIFQQHDNFVDKLSFWEFLSSFSLWASSWL